MKKKLGWEIIYLNEVYKFSLGIFSTKYIFYVLILKNTIGNKIFHFLTKICEIQNER